MSAILAPACWNPSASISTAQITSSNWLPVRVSRWEVAVDGVVTSMAYSFHSRTVALQLEDGQTRKLTWGEFIGDTHTTATMTSNLPGGYSIS